MKRRLLRSAMVLLPLALIVGVVPALRVRVLGLFRGEMFFHRLPYSQWVDRLGSRNARVAAEDELKAAGQDAVPLLAKLLEEPNPDLRWEAAHVLAEIGPRVATNAELAARALLSAMYDRDFDLGMDGSSVGGSDAAPPTPQARAMARRNAAARQAAEQALVSLGPAAIPSLIEGLKDPRRLTRADAARLLGAQGAAASAAGPALTDALGLEADESAQWEEVQAIDRIGAGAPVLAAAAGAALDHGSPAVRAWAGRTLARLGPAEVRPELPAILKAMEQPLDAQTQTDLAAALRGLGLDAVTGLVPLATGENATARLSASAALASIGAPAVPPLVDTLNSPSPAARRRAATVLETIGPPAAPAAGPLGKLAKDPDAGVRAAALAALSAIAPAAPETAAAVFTGLDDVDTSVRREAAIHLSALPAETPGLAGAVTRAVKDADPRARAAGIAVMASMAHPAESPADTDADVLPILADAVAGRGVEPASPSSTKRTCQLDALGALAALGRRARTALPAVLEALKSPDAAIADEAVNALARIDSTGEASAPFLADLLKDADRHWVAVNALLQLGATKQAFSAVAGDIRSADPAVAGTAIQWVYQQRPRDRDAMLFDDIVPALVARLGDGALGRQAGNALEQLSASEALVPALQRGLTGPDPKIARGAAGVLEDIALYDRQSPASPAAAEALRAALRDMGDAGDADLHDALARAVRRLR